MGIKFDSYYTLKIMDFNDLANKIHINAVNHGFWKNQPSYNHFMMLVISEIGELINADRKNRHAKVEQLKEYSKQSFNFNYYFEDWIKDTVEDEFADIVIRLLDIAGAAKTTFENVSPSRFGQRSFSLCDNTENALELIKLLIREDIDIDRILQNGIEYIMAWTKSLGIDLAWHIEQKMKYNETRPFLHGKNY